LGDSFGFHVGAPFAKAIGRVPAGNGPEAFLENTAVRITDFA
jgi:hypothetical protein